MEGGLEDVGELYFHTLNADSGFWFSCSPNDERDVAVDAFERDEMEPLEDGPFAGKVDVERRSCTGKPFLRMPRD